MKKEITNDKILNDAFLNYDLFLDKKEKQTKLFFSRLIFVLSILTIVTYIIETI